MDDQAKIIDVVEIILHGSIGPDIDDDYAGAGFLYFEGPEEEVHLLILLMPMR